MKFWAVLGSRCCRGKKLPTAMSMQFFGWFFQLFVGKKKFKIFKKYCSIRTETLHSIKAKEISKHFGKYSIWG